MERLPRNLRVALLAAIATTSVMAITLLGSFTAEGTGKKIVGKDDSAQGPGNTVSCAVVSVLPSPHFVDAAIVLAQSYLAVSSSTSSLCQLILLLSNSSSGTATWQAEGASHAPRLRRAGWDVITVIPQNSFHPQLGSLDVALLHDLRGGYERVLYVDPSTVFTLSNVTESFVALEAVDFHVVWRQERVILWLLKPKKGGSDERLSSGAGALHVSSCSDASRLPIHLFCPGRQPWTASQSSTGLNPGGEVSQRMYRLWWELYEAFHESQIAAGPNDHLVEELQEYKDNAPDDAPVDPRTHVFMMRHTESAYFEWYHRWQEKHLLRETGGSQATMVMMEGSAGQSCDRVCAAHLKACTDVSLQWWSVQTCEGLKNTSRILKSAVCRESDEPGMGLVAPAQRSVDHVYYVSPLRARDSVPTCAARDPAARRLCPCVSILQSAFPRFDDVSHGKMNPNNDHTHVPCVNTQTTFTDADHDAACAKFLSSHISHKPPNQIEMLPTMFFSDEPESPFGSSIKLVANLSNTYAVVKLPQVSAPFGPFGEVVSYLIDRALGLHLVPPTTLGFVPLCDIESAAARLGEDVVKNKVAPDVTSQLLSGPNNNNAVPMPDSGRLSVVVSIQLWVDNLQPARHKSGNSNVDTLGWKLFDRLISHMPMHKNVNIPTIATMDGEGQLVHLGHGNLFDMVDDDDDDVNDDKNSNNNDGLSCEMIGFSHQIRNLIRQSTFFEAVLRSAVDSGRLSAATASHVRGLAPPEGVDVLNKRADRVVRLIEKCR
eukprot:PhM_4_TR11419/c0_g2_i2/m.19988